MDPLDYMVEDCWLHLFQFLSPKDKQALCDTCETFQTMLQPQKTTWGFELILPCIMKQLDTPRNPSSQQIKKALSVRSVCKSWRSAFDKICGLCTLKGASQFVLFKHVHSSYDFKDVSKLERFHKTFQTHSGNPFVGRQAEIYASGFVEPLGLEGNALDADGAENPEKEASAGGNEIEEREEVEHEGQARDLHVAPLRPNHHARVRTLPHRPYHHARVRTLHHRPNHHARVRTLPHRPYHHARVRTLPHRPYHHARVRTLHHRPNHHARVLTTLRDTIRERQLKNCKLLMELLPKHGKQIDYLSVKNSTYTDMSKQLDTCKFLQFVLCNTPNVVALELSIRPHWDLGEDTATFKKEVREYFEANPLPAMPNLLILNLHGVNPTLENLMLEAYGGKLTVLYSRTDASTIPTPIWSNMRCLRVLELPNPSFETIEKILWALHSPLEVLDLQSTGMGWRIRNQNVGKTFFIDKFLLAAQHLPLEKVFISLQSGTLKESVPFPQDFPRHMTITYLNIELVNSISLTFLPFLPRMKELFIGGIKFNSPYPTQF